MEEFTEIIIYNLVLIIGNLADEVIEMIYALLKLGRKNLLLFIPCTLMVITLSIIQLFLIQKRENIIRHNSKNSIKESNTIEILRRFLIKNEIEEFFEEMNNMDCSKMSRRAKDSLVVLENRYNQEKYRKITNTSKNDIEHNEIVLALAQLTSEEFYKCLKND